MENIIAKNLKSRHYNNIFTDVWDYYGYRAVYKPSCLRNPETEGAWLIDWIEPREWTDQTLVVLHCQDFLTQDDSGEWLELTAIEQHYGDRAGQVVVITWNMDLHLEYSGPCHVVYFPGHTYDLINKWHRAEYQGWQTKFHNTKRPNNWQCLNGTARHHRRLVWNWILQLPNGHASLGFDHPLVKDTYEQWTDSSRIHDQDNFFTLEWLYKSTQINVVTETQYRETQGIITEKTYFAFAGCQVPIIIGHKNIVQQCRDLGFDMFDDIIDNSYDSVENANRWIRALNDNRSRLLEGIDTQALMPRLIYNQEHLMNGLQTVLLGAFLIRVREVVDSLAK